MAQSYLINFQIFSSQPRNTFFLSLFMPLFPSSPYIEYPYRLANIDTPGFKAKSKNACMDATTQSTICLRTTILAPTFTSSTFMKLILLLKTHSSHQRKPLMHWA
jgi:hypothetical protein